MLTPKTPREIARIVREELNLIAEWKCACDDCQWQRHIERIEASLEQ